MLPYLLVSISVVSAYEARAESKRRYGGIRSNLFLVPVLS